MSLPFRLSYSKVRPFYAKSAYGRVMVSVLGSLLINDGNCDVKIQRCIGIVKECFHKLAKY